MDTLTEQGSKISKDEFMAFVMPKLLDTGAAQVAAPIPRAEPTHLLTPCLFPCHVPGRAVIIGPSWHLLLTHVAHFLSQSSGLGAYADPTGVFASAPTGSSALGTFF